MVSGLFVAVLLFSILVPQAQAEAPLIPSGWMPLEALNSPPEALLETREDIAAYALKLDEMGSFGGEFYGTMEHESMGWQNIQSRYYYKAGGQEQSYGVCQIHLPSHPDITLEQAYDPKWCLDWSAEQFKEGRQWQWSSWKLLYN